MAGHTKSKSPKQILFSSIWLIIGAVLAAYGLEVFLIPNRIIDGGVIGVSILLSKFIGSSYLYPMVLVLNIPFIFLAYKTINKTLVIQMLIALTSFSFLGHWIAESNHAIFHPYRGELLEIVVIGGLLLGLGVGIIIRAGGCVDGTEILGIMLNKKFGVSVGSVVLAINFIIFSAAGLIFGDWQPPIQSLITFFIVIKIMDMVIVGFDEMKSVMIFSKKADEIADILMHEYGLGLTLLQGKGGYTKEPTEIIYLIAERLQLAEIKHIAQCTDPHAFVAIDNLHEVASSNIEAIASKK